MFALIVHIGHGTEAIDEIAPLLELPGQPIKALVCSRKISTPVQTFTDIHQAIAAYPDSCILNLSNIPLNLGEKYCIIEGLTARKFWTWLQQLVQPLQKSPAPTSTVAPIIPEYVIGQSPIMQEIFDLALRVAPTPTTVLIRGESGTGKEVIARFIHDHSPQRQKPLIVVNCTALSPQLIESELFGHRRGSFTGAVEDKVGLLEQAHQGTVFLDEIGDMPLEMQAKLLRFLQSGEIRPIGETRTRRVKVRIIAATNRNLERAIEQGYFRNDLFYRLNAFTLQLPPLRQRKEDIPLLATHFLKIARARINKPVSRISPAAMQALQQYHWPGNLRELKNVIERAVVLTSGDEITTNHLPLDWELSLHPDPLRPTPNSNLLHQKARLVQRFEYEMVARLLSEHQGNVTHAARAAGIPRRTFQRLMKKHGIKANHYR